MSTAPQGVDQEMVDQAHLILSITCINEYLPIFLKNSHFVALVVMVPGGKVSWRDI